MVFGTVKIFPQYEQQSNFIYLKCNVLNASHYLTIPQKSQLKTHVK